MKTWSVNCSNESNWAVLACVMSLNYAVQILNFKSSLWRVKCLSVTIPIKAKSRYWAVLTCGTVNVYFIQKFLKRNFEILSRFAEGVHLHCPSRDETGMIPGSRDESHLARDEHHPTREKIQSRIVKLDLWGRHVKKGTKSNRKYSGWTHITLYIHLYIKNEV